MKSTIKLLCLIEATTITGPAKNLLNFCRLMRSDRFNEAGLPRLEISIVTFHRLLRQGKTNRDRDELINTAPNSFVASARAEGIEVDVIDERFRFDPTIIEKLRGVVMRRSPDIIQTH